jgi:predicted NUDIX family phosphoesterase
MPDWPDEKVLVVPARLLDELGRFQGFTHEVERYLSVLLCPDHFSFLPRAQAEEDPSYKQIIPYCILKAGGSLFRYRRGRKQGERRLHDLESIGIGGHISHLDVTLFNQGQSPYEDAMLRELHEEVVLETPYHQRCVGLINDDSTLVGQVHLGVVHLFELEEPKARPREASLCEARFVPLATLRIQRHRLETWSRCCLDALFPLPELPGQAC